MYYIYVLLNKHDIASHVACAHTLMWLFAYRPIVSLITLPYIMHSMKAYLPRVVFACWKNFRVNIDVLITVIIY